MTKQQREAAKKREALINLHKGLLLLKKSIPENVYDELQKEAPLYWPDEKVNRVFESLHPGKNYYDINLN